MRQTCNFKKIDKTMCLFVSEDKGAKICVRLDFSGKARIVKVKTIIFEDITKKFRLFSEIQFLKT